MKIATICYESQTQAAVIDRLKQAGVQILMDVRAVAASRRAGFSKTLLASSLADAGIGYIHLRALGAPKTGRDAARAGRIQEMRDIFAAHLEEPDAQLQLAQAEDIARSAKVALLCYEAEACRCHRQIVADRLHEALELEIENL